MSMRAPEYQVFTGERCRDAYRLNRFLVAMTDARNREAFARDAEAHMGAWQLSETERDLVRRRDFQGMLDYGAVIYAIGKAGGALGASLVEMGVQMRGGTLEAFLQTRRFSQKSA